MLSRIQLRVRNRRLGSRRYALFSNLNPALFAQSMLGCVVVLLIVEMMSPQPHHGIPFDKYIARNTASMPAAVRDDAIKVSVARDGAIYLGGTKIAGSDLPQQLRQRAEGSAQHKIFLVVDQRAKFADVSVVLDDLQRAGLWDVAFLTELRLPAYKN